MSAVNSTAPRRDMIAGISINTPAAAASTFSTVEGRLAELEKRLCQLRDGLNDVTRRITGYSAPMSTADTIPDAALVDRRG